MSAPEASSSDGEERRLQARASEGARIYQAGRDQHIAQRDLHLHYEDGVRRSRRAAPEAAVGECPYPGLAAFGEDQALWFFGRDAVTAQLLVRLDERLRNGGALALVAPSGAGKSSVLRAGLLPALARGALPAVGSASWPRLLLAPGTHPVATLAAGLAETTGVGEQEVTDALAAGPQACVALLRATAGARRLVVVVDHLEELFTLCSSERERRDFLTVLAALGEAGPQGTGPVALVIYGLRSDFYTPCADYPQLRAVLQDGQLVVGPMTESELREAILFPARAAGLEIEPGLVELLLRDLGTHSAGGSTRTSSGVVPARSYEAGRLPLLAHALRATWQQRHGHCLTVDGYQSTGAILHAVATTAERLYAGLGPAEQDVARAMFLRLVKIGDGAEDTRRRLPYTEVLNTGSDPEAAAVVIDVYTRGRLLTRHRDTVEITHEALLFAWPDLRRWIDTDRAGHLVRQGLEEDAAAWGRAHRDPGMLYRGHRLDAARTWADRSHHNPPSPLAAAFLATSTRHVWRAARLRRSLIAILSALALIAGAGAVVAFEQRATARAQRDEAVFNQVRAEAERLRFSQASLAAQLDLVAHRMRPDDPDVRSRLIADAGSPLSTPAVGHTNAVNMVAYSPDGHTMATGADDGTVRLWDVTAPARPAPLRRLKPDGGVRITSTAFSPDGRTLAAGSDSGVTLLWDVTEPAHPAGLRSLTSSEIGAAAVAFSPDHRTLATARSDGSVRLWDLAHPKHSAVVTEAVGDNGVTPSLSFTSDGKTLASAASGTARLWNVADSAHPASLGKPLKDCVGANSVAFGVRGRTLACSGQDGTVRLLDVTDTARPALIGNPLTGRGISLGGLAFSPDGLTVASATDREVELWNVADEAHPRPIGRLLGHTGFVTAVAFRPDGGGLATVGTDRTVLLWAQPRMLVTRTSSPLTSLKFSRSGRMLAGTSDDNVTRLWNVADPTPSNLLGGRLAGPVDSINSPSFSPDFRTLALGIDEPIRLWDLADPGHPTLLGRLSVGTDYYISALAFSPDGHALASGVGGVVQLWDTADRAHPTSLGRPLISSEGYVNAMVFSPNGHVLASAWDQEGHDAVRLWDVNELSRPRPLKRFPGIGDTVESLQFSPDGRILALVSSQGSAWLWQAGSEKRPTQLAMPGADFAQVLSLAFSSDGRMLATGGLDGVRLWDVTDPSRPRALGSPLNPLSGLVTGVAFGPDGQTLATSGVDGTVRLWEADLGRAINRICELTTSTLTSQQWHQHVSGLPFDPPCR
ncbi:nSTAND1 domain-containing NTPase [Streptomyces sp. NPDC003343]